MTAPRAAAATAPAAPARVGVTTAWALAASVELRQEPFGALAYDFHTRRLSFLKSRRLVEVVRRLGDSDDVAAALTACGVTERERPSYVEALGTLAQSGLITPRTEPTP